MIRLPGAMPRRLVAVALGVAVTLGACKSASDAPLPEYHPLAYRLGRGDEIRIITFNEDQLTGDFRLDDQGSIALPLLGVVHAGDLTTQQLAGMIERSLKEKNLLTSASVSVEVRAYRPIFVLGEVAHPGQYPYQPGMTMLTAVAIAGGFTYRAVRKTAEVIRTDGDNATTGQVSPQSFIAPGDVINIDERFF